MCGHILQAYFRLKRGFFGGHCLSVLNWCAMTRGSRTGAFEIQPCSNSVLARHLECSFDLCVWSWLDAFSVQTYHYTMKQDITVDCLDPSGSCSRSSCECDGKLFADIWHLGNPSFREISLFSELISGWTRAIQRLMEWIMTFSFHQLTLTARRTAVRMIWPVRIVLSRKLKHNLTHRNKRDRWLFLGSRS